MVSETIALIAVFGALTGAGLNSLRAYLQAPESEKFSFRKCFGGLVSALLPAMAVVGFADLDQLAATGIVALFVTEALAGAGISTILSQAHK